jgi:hypothetical protein
MNQTSSPSQYYGARVPPVRATPTIAGHVFGASPANCLTEHWRDFVPPNTARLRMIRITRTAGCANLRLKNTIAGTVLKS